MEQTSESNTTNIFLNIIMCRLLKVYGQLCLLAFLLPEKCFLIGKSLSLPYTPSLVEKGEKLKSR